MFQQSLFTKKERWLNRYLVSSDAVQYSMRKNPNPAQVFVRLDRMENDGSFKLLKATKIALGTDSEESVDATFNEYVRDAGYLDKCDNALNALDKQTQSTPKTRRTTTLPAST